MKLPVMPAIGGTLTIVSKDWLTLLRITWLPMVFGYAVSYGLLFGFYQSLAQSSDAATAAYLPMILLVYVAWLGLYVILFAGMLRFVVNGDKPKLPFYLRFGGDELRIFVTWLLFAIILVGLYLGVAIMVGIATGIGMTAASSNPAALASVMIGAAILGGAICAWFLLRLSLATPAAVGAQTVGIGKSWSKTKGNVWRLLAYWLILGVALFGFQTAVAAVLYPDYLPAILDFISATFSGDSSGVQSALQTILTVTNPPGIGWLYVVRLIVSSIAGVIGMWVIAVSGGVAWRYLTEEDRPEKHFE